MNPCRADRRNDARRLPKLDPHGIRAWRLRRRVHNGLWGLRYLTVTKPDGEIEKHPYKVFTEVAVVA